jgi:hypothetical protein
LYACIRATLEVGGEVLDEYCAAIGKKSICSFDKEGDCADKAGERG